MKNACSKLLATGVTFTVCGIIFLVVLSIFGILDKDATNISSSTVEQIIDTNLNSDTSHYSDTTDAEFNSIEIKMDFGEISVISGDEFSISGDNVREGDISYSVDNGKMVIKCSSDWKNNGMNLLNGKSPVVYITIPAQKYENAEFQLNAGGLYVNDISTANLAVNVNAGEATISSTYADNSAEIKMNAGACYFFDSSLANSSLKVNAGELNLETCTLNGENNVDVAMGEVNMLLTGSRNDFAIDVDCSAGEVNINGMNYVMEFDYTTMTYSASDDEAASTEIVSDEKNTENSINVELSAGECSIEFMEQN